MAAIFNDQRVLGVRLVADGTVLYNGQSVIGIVDAAGSSFVNNIRTVGVDVLAADEAVHNDLPMLGAVLIADGRQLYNNMLVVPAKAVSGSLSGSVGNDGFTKILLHMDGADGGAVFADNAAGGSAHVWTASAATTSTAQAKFGTASLAAGASAGKITTPDHADFTLGAGDFTIDGWINRAAGDGTLRFISGQCDGAGGATTRTAELCVNAANVVLFQVWAGGALTTVTGTTPIIATGWNHVAAVRTGNVLKLFLNGVQEGGDVAFASAIQDSANAYAVGGLGEVATLLWNGFIDEFRLSVGVARWTANFTPPTAPYS